MRNAISLVSFPLTVLLLLLSPGCNRGPTQLMLPPVIESSFKHPVLIMEVITIPSSGIVTTVDGSAFLLVNESKRFCTVRLGMGMGNDDVLSMNAGATIEVKFKDGSSFKHQVNEETKWFAFKSRSQS